MARTALSQLQRSGITRADLDTRKKQAVEAYKKELLKPIQERRGAEKIAAEYGPGISRTTVWRLAKKGTKTELEAQDAKNMMSRACRMLLHDWILELHDRALPVGRDLMKKKAKAILRATVDPMHPGVSDSWIDRFYASPMCHDIATHWTSSLPKDRARAVNPNTVKSWFDMIEREIVIPGIPPENICGFDETNFLEGQAHKTRVAGRRGSKNTYQRQGGSRKSCTVMVTICADGTTLTPTVIFKGTKLLKRWGAINPLKVK